MSRGLRRAEPDMVSRGPRELYSDDDEECSFARRMASKSRILASIRSVKALGQGSLRP